MKRMFLTMALAIIASVFSAQAQDVITDPVAQQAQQEAIKAQKAAEKEAKKQQKAIEKREKEAKKREKEIKKHNDAVKKANNAQKAAERAAEKAQKAAEKAAAAPGDLKLPVLVPMVIRRQFWQSCTRWRLRTMIPLSTR